MPTSSKVPHFSSVSRLIGYGAPVAAAGEDEERSLFVVLVHGGGLGVGAAKVSRALK
jgi:hypothetical protein